MSSRWSIALLTYILSSTAASAAVFTGSTTLGGIFSVGGNFPISWDLSGISAIDTPDGSKITGTLTGTYSAAPSSGFSYMILYAARSLDSSTSNLDFITSAYLSTALSTTGSTLVNTMAVNAFLTTPRGSACSVSAALNSGSTALGLAGSLVSGPNSQSCSLGGITGLSPLALRTEFGLTVRSPEGGDGTVTINLGSSAIGELRLASEAVPEPATLLLLAAAVPLLFYKRRITGK